MEIYDPTKHGEPIQEDSPTLYDPEIHGSRQIIEPNLVNWGTGEVDIIPEENPFRVEGDSLGHTLLNSATGLLHSGADLAEDTGQAVVRGLTNAGRGMLQTGAMMSENLIGTPLDWAGLPDEYNPFLGVTDRTVEQYPYLEKENAGILESIIGKTAELAPGLAMGGAAGKTLVTAAIGTPSTMGGAGKLIRYLAIGGIADMTAALTTQNPDDENWFIGPDGWISEGLKEDSLAAKKFNLALDELVLGAGFSTAIGALAKIFKIVPGPQIKGVADWLSPRRQENLVVDELMSLMSGKDTSVDSYKRVRAIISDARFKDQVDELSKLGEDLINTPRFKHTYGILIQNLMEQADNLPPEERKMLLAEVRKFEDAIRAHMGEHLQTAIDAPIDSARRGLQQVEDTLGGGAENISRRGPEIAEDIAQNYLEPGRRSFADLQTRRIQLAQNLENSIKQNPEFGKYINDNVVLGDPTLSSTGEVAQKTIDIIEGLVTRKKELYDVLDTIADVPADSASVKTFVEGMNAPKNIPSEVADALKAGGLTVKRMDELASFHLSDRIAYLLNKGQNQAAGELIELKRLMTHGQLDSLAKKMGKKGGKQKEFYEALTRARDFYKEEIVPIHNNPILSNIYNIMESQNYSELMKLPESRKTLGQGVAEMVRPFGTGTPEYVQDTIRFIDKYSDRVGSEGMELVALDKIGESIRRVVDMGSAADPEAILKITDDIRRVQGLLSPEKATELSSILTSLRDGSIDLKRLDAVIDLSSKQVAAAEKQVYDRILKEFFSEHQLPVENGLEGFRKLFTSSGNEKRLSTILDNITDPADLAVFKGAYANILREAALEKSGGTTVLKAFSDPTSSWAQYAQKLYGEEGYGILKKMTDAALESNMLRKGRSNLAVDVNEVQRRGKVAIQSILTWIFGVLNPTAARIRTVTSAYVDEKSVTNDIREITDMVLADPDKFLEIADRIIRQKEMVFSDPVLEHLIKRLMIKGTGRGTEDYNEEGLDILQ